MRPRWTSAGDRTLGDVWREVPSKQLLVVGDPAQGKTSGVLLLTPELLAQRSESDPVPVLLPISSWNPAEHLHAWAARRLADDYPALTDRRIYGPDAPLRLVLDRRVVLVLDGLDELPRDLRGSAVEALNYAAVGDYPLIVTCRRADFEQIGSERLPLLPRAMVVAARPVAATTAGDRRDTVGLLGGLLTFVVATTSNVESSSTAGLNRVFADQARCSSCALGGLRSWSSEAAGPRARA
ncbi:MAG: hypothetical protein HOY78_18170 [Saccharothrix sp.]|nr:hypothetical protein [Saccharothrix sp.]